MIIIYIRAFKALLVMLKIMSLALAVLSEMIIPIASFATGDYKIFENKRFHYDGHVFFNVTNSATQGEKYLLNQQLSNVKLGTQLQVTDTNTLRGLLIYNTFPTPVTPTLFFDQLYDEYQKESPGLFFEAGKKWLNFGSYKNDLIYKPLTKALGQTNQIAVIAGYDSLYYANLSLFDPYSRIKPSSLPFYYNLNVGMHSKTYDLGGSFIRSLAESQMSQYNKGFGGFLFRPIHSDVPGFAAYLNINHNKLSTYLSYVAAIHSFLPEEMSYNAKGASPKAFSLQSGYELSFRNIPYKILAFYDYSFESLALRLPQERIGVGLSAYPVRYLSVQFQYFKDYGYPDDAIASGLNRPVFGDCSKVNNFALQAILNF
jgi:hypothetical protein